MRYDYEIKYGRGKENTIADALSRISSQELYTIVVSPVFFSITDEIKRSWKKISIHTNHHLGPTRYSRVIASLHLGQ
jgi:hypothetical protein